MCLASSCDFSDILTSNPELCDIIYLMDKTKYIYRYISGLLILLLLAGCAISHRTISKKFLDEKGNIIQSSKDIFIQVPELRLPESEKLTYQMTWIGIPVGTLTISTKGIQNINGRDAYILEAVIKSNFFLSAIYKIEDRFVSYMDTEKLYSLRHEVHRREGFYKKDAATDFDQINHKAHFRNAIDKSEKTFDIPSDVQDTLSACYYFMLLPVKVGEKIAYAVCNNEENYQLLGVVKSKAFLRTALGEKEAFLIQPYAKLQGEKVEKGNLSAYFSCDKRRIPLLGILKGPIFTEATFFLSKIEHK
jgi:hypothetical protein